MTRWCLCDRLVEKGIDILFENMLVYYEPTLYRAVGHLRSAQVSYVNDVEYEHDCDGKRV